MTDHDLISVALPYFALLTLIAAGVLIFGLVSHRLTKSGRKRRSRLGMDVLFIAYFIVLFWIILWPLPNTNDIACGRERLSTYPGFQPFRFAVRAYQEAQSGFILSAIGIVGEIVANVLLFVPFAIYLLTIWQLRIGAVLLACAGLSLLFEVTQLTGVWGAYPCSYRVFDVDDLLANSAGALIAYLLTLHQIKRTTAAPRRFGCE